jgi:hypothetical protein
MVQQEADDQERLSVLPITLGHKAFLRKLKLPE